MDKEEIVGAGNGVEYAQVGGKKMRKSKMSKKKTGRKMKKNKTMKRKTLKKSKKSKKSRKKVKN